MDEQCVLCGLSAAVRVGGTSFCASCGLNQFSAEAAPVPARRHSRRTAVFALFSSGILVKTLLGAVAVAAVGGAASTVLQAEQPVVETTVAIEATTSTTVVEETLAEEVLSVAGAAEGAGEVIADDPAVAAFVSEVQAWADCVADAASAHSDGPFDPFAACGDRPNPPGHDEDGPGNSEDAPGHDEDGPGNSEDAPGHDEDGPGSSEDAPGHDEDGPGSSEDAPGHDDDGPGNSEQAPGQTREK